MTKKPRHKVIHRTPGVEITNSATFAVDWNSFVGGIATVAAQGFATYIGLTDGTSNAVTALVSAAGALRQDTPVGQRAWTLFCLSFAWAFDELREVGDLDGTEAVAAVRKALQRAKVIIENRHEVMPASFLTNPTSLPLYSTIRDEFIRQKSAYRPNKGEPALVLQARFDAAFNRAVYEIWSRNPDAFQPLEVALAGPGVLASAFDVQWQAYRRTIVHDFEVKPVFGQEQSKIAVSQLFVPLRATWRKESETQEYAAHSPTRTREKPQLHVVELIEELDRWISHGAADDSTRLIGGGPGSGKSTTVRALARRMADREDRRPLFVPLQYIDIGRDLREAVNSFFVDRTRGTFQQPPLSRTAVENGPPLVLIFDGLDELARPGEAANEVAQLFITKLNQLITSLNGDGTSPVRTVVTGRMPSFQAARTYASATNRRSYEVVGFLPCTNIVGASELEEGEQKLAKLDQRLIWWKKYAAAVGGPVQVPQALTDRSLQGLTHEPLLCYLLALSGYAVDNWEEAAENRNRIYERLVDEVWKRGWGEGGRQGAGKHLSKDHFNRLMETIALAAWRGGDTRVASEGRFLETLSIMHADEAWDEFKRDSGADITNLAMNFYLKSSEIERRGFEFTHKSFGDYLIGRALLTVAASVLELGPRRLEAAAQEWFDATSTGILTFDAIQFVRDEIRLAISRNEVKNVSKIKDYFTQLASFAIQEGLPAHRNVGRNWRSADALQNNAETAIWAILNASALGLGARDESSARVKIDWGSNQGFARLLDRLGKRRSRALSRVTRGSTPDPIGGNEDLMNWISEFTVRACLAYVEAEGADLFEVYLHEADFRHANLEGAELSGAHLCDAIVSGANLKRVNFQRAHLDNVDFMNADLEGSMFVDARVGRAKFTALQLSQIALTPLSLADSHVSIDPDTIEIKPHDEPDVPQMIRRIERVLLYLKSPRPGRRLRDVKP